MRIDHIAIAVNDLEPALTNFKNVLTIDHIDLEDVPTEKVKVAILNLGDTRIELLQPTVNDSPISKFLTEKGEGIHHLAITADDIEKDVERASSNGAKILGGIRSELVLANIRSRRWKGSTYPFSTRITETGIRKAIRK